MTSIGLVCLVSGRKAAFVLAIKSWLVALVSPLSLAQQHRMQARAGGQHVNASNNAEAAISPKQFQRIYFPQQSSPKSCGANLTAGK